VALAQEFFLEAQAKMEGRMQGEAATVEMG
jgi:hypothetical protein